MPERTDHNILLERAKVRRLPEDYQMICVSAVMDGECVLERTSGEELARAQ